MFDYILVIDMLFCMKFTQLLGFSTTEKQIYKVLSSRPQTIAELVETSELPRMTVHYALERFMNRGLVSRIKRKKHFRYLKISPHDIFKSLDVFNNSLITTSLDTTIFTDYDQIVLLYRTLIEESENNRLRTIQTTVSTKNIYDRCSLEQLHELDRMMNESGVIVDDIVEATFFRPIFQKYPDDFEIIIKSFLERTLVTNVVPENTLGFKNDLVISPESVALIDWQAETAIHITSDQLHLMFLSFYNLLTTFSTKASFRELANPYLKTI